MGNSVSAIAKQSWDASCVDMIKQLNPSQGLVDRNGNPMSFISDQTSGITYELCVKECGPDKIYQAFIFINFASSFINWLLPWIALIAQLPYESSGPGNNIMSGLMAIGSPAFITYSLSLTILNRSWIRGRFSKLKRDSKAVAELAPHLSERIRVAELLLREAQQTPVRVSQDDGWLSSLIVLPENESFWMAVGKDLRNTQRSFSASLLAQMLVAFVAFLLAVINAFAGGFRDSNSIRLVATSSIWIWMIPVIIGWIVVGTQCRNGSIHDALHDDRQVAFRALPYPSTDGSLICKGKQEGIINPTDLKVRYPSWLGFSLIGDEGTEGPAYNYSRVFTWLQCADHMETAFLKVTSNLLKNPEKCTRVDGKPWGGEENSIFHLEPDCFVGTMEQVAEYSGLDPTLPVNAYIPWSSMPADVWHRIAIASVVALFVQWGTTGPGIVLGYVSGTIGLGCQSGSFLLYGLAATVAWFLLTISSILSHAVMLRHQNLKGDNKNRQAQLLYRHSPLCALVVCTRYAGKTIAVLNAVWLVTFNLLECLDAFENCWCAANVLTAGRHGWAAFLSFSYGPLETLPSYPIGGLLFSFVVCASSLAFFSLAGAGGG